eukprot:5126931-Amphidinium_carterae.4
MDESVTDLLHHRAQQEGGEAQQEFEGYQNEMEKLEERLWKQVDEERGGKLSDKESYITAWDARDDEKMNQICYMYFNAQRELRHQWRREQIDKDIQKNETNLLKVKKREDRQQAEKRKTRSRSTRRSSINNSKSKAYSSTHSASIIIRMSFYGATGLQDNRQYVRTN